MMQFPSRRMLAQLTALQANMLQLAGHRNTALRLLAASRHAATVEAQREFWLEFSWLDQEYRTAVHRLARFCLTYRGGSSLRAVSEEDRHP
jgi:hypothetical protein